MRKIRVDELKEGMIASRTICDERGTILVSNGVVLTVSIIERLQNFDVRFIYIQVESNETAKREIAAELRQISDDIYAQQVIKIKENMGMIEGILYPALEKPDVKLFVEKYDELLFKHSLRTAILSLNLGLIKRYNKSQLNNLALGSILHDCGMESFIDLDMEHPLKGYGNLCSNQALDMEAALICLQHHERYDGSGLPFAFGRTQITELAFLVAVVDYYDRFLIRCKDSKKAFFATVEKKGSYFEPGMTDLFGSTLDWHRFYSIS
ncbi:MAG: HD domain-containing protein [Pelosinus sp.]|nr:HD domain-containing protein [Pelosinus sp.]